MAHLSSCCHPRLPEEAQVALILHIRSEACREAMRLTAILLDHTLGATTRRA